MEALPRRAAPAGAPFLGAWELLGPFDPGSDPGPDAVDDDGWRTFDERTINRAYDDYNDLRLWLRRERGQPAVEGSVVYLRLWVHSATGVEAELRLGACGPLQAWVDGDRVATLDGWTLRRDARRAGVRLAAGWHRLRVRTEHAGGPWGFYARLTDAGGERLEQVTAALAGPGTLTVGTAALPRAYVGWPYVGLDNPGGEPRASAFRLMAGGGAPPYRWAAAGTPLAPGLRLDPDAGTLTGTPERTGSYDLRVSVEDAAGRRAERSLTLVVEDPPTRWYDEQPLGLSIHFDKPDAIDVGLWDRTLAASPGYADQWAALARRAGASVLVLTAKHHDSWANWPTEVRRSDGVAAQRTGTDTLAAVRRAAGENEMRFGIYFSTLDTWHPGYRHDFPDYLRFQFRQLEEVVERYRPSMVWLDGHWDEPTRDWAYDPLFSLVHGLVPEAVIANNPGRRTLNVGDLGYGDVDVRTFESHTYWGHMPRPQAPRRNSRHLPARSTPSPATGGRRVRIRACSAAIATAAGASGSACSLGWSATAAPCCWGSVPATPERPGSPPPGELYPGASAVLTGIGDWLYPDRAEAFCGVRPGPLAPAPWGRCVQRPGRIYLHLPPGPADGWPTSRLRLGPLPRDTEVTAARLVPSRQRITFGQRDGAVTLELAGVPADPVLSLIALETT